MQLHISFGIKLGLMLVIVLFAQIGTSHATSFLIETDDPAIQDDNLCSIREAIDNANDDAQTHDDCPAGSGADSIDLDGRTITFTDAPAAYDDSGHNALPTLDGTISLSNGTLQRSSTLTTCAGGQGNRDEFRFFVVDFGATVSIDHMHFDNGCASDVASGGFDLRGGAIYSVSDLNITNSHFSNNIAANVGGAIHSEDDLIVANSSFVGNSGRGTISLIADNATILNSTFYANTGRVVIFSGSFGDMTVINSTVAGNTVSDRAIDRNGSGATLTVHNTIVADANNNNCKGNIVSSHSYSTDATCNFGASNGADNANIVLGTLTQAANSTFYYPLLSGDALNGGNNSLLPNESGLGVDVDGDSAVDDPIDVDQRGAGFARIGQGVVDAGAYEEQSLRGDCNADGLLDAGDIAALNIELSNPASFDPIGCDVDVSGVIDSADAACTRARAFDPDAICDQP